MSLSSHGERKLSCQHLLLVLLLYQIPLCSAVPSSTFGQDPLVSSSSNESVTLTFDDIACSTELEATSKGFCPISHYNFLDFSSFTTFDSVGAAESNLISPGDADCALSKPNALFAWRRNRPSLWPRFVLNATTAGDYGLDEYFDFHGLAVKPMNSTVRFARVIIQAVGVDFRDPVAPRIKTSYSLFIASTRDEQWRQHFFNISGTFPGWGKAVNMVEMWAEGPDGQDWPLCMDDLRLSIHKAGDSSEDARRGLDGAKENRKYLEWRDIDLGSRGARLSAQGYYTRG